MFTISDANYNTATVIIGNFVAMFTALFTAYLMCTPTPSKDIKWFASSKTHPTIRATEMWFLKYGVIWIIAFAIVVLFELYATWNALALFIFMFSLALPLYLQPILYPALTKEENVSLLSRFSLLSNVWIGIFGFVGNYWYTHYFYSVLGAHYTMESYDLNGVPIPMYFATHFYFCFYHVIGNCIIRRIITGFKPSFFKNLFLILAVLCMAYTTAFMETATIANYKCYTFDDWHYAATIGSLFYAIYFIVSFPMFYIFSSVEKKGRRGTVIPSLYQTVIESLATAMLVLCLLDFVRVGLGQDLHVQLVRPCKLNSSLSCFGDRVC